MESSLFLEKAIADDGFTNLSKRKAPLYGLEAHRTSDIIWRDRDLRTYTDLICWNTSSTNLYLQPQIKGTA